MPDEINSKWNYAVTYVEFYFAEQKLACGSGFFWKGEKDQIFLISNWHNFSGRSNEDGKPLSTSAAIPNSIKFLNYQKISETNDQGQFALNITTTTMPLLHQKTGENLWYEHPQLGRQVDLAALYVGNVNNFNHVIEPANTLESDSAEKFYPSQDVFIIGYPLGLIAAKIPVPVWKRGTIATEPYINPDGKPLIYVDAATRKGMSGSIVLAKDTTFGNYQKKDGTKTVNALIAKHEQILGIYSGRLHPHNVEAQLGIVWKRYLIDELVSAKKKANTE